MPKVSIIIPAYNAMAYLPETLESLRQQTYQDFEVIIVDDGSSDGIQAWVAQLSDSQIRLIGQSNQGASTARNTGIALARGEYVAVLDADDLWHSTKLEKQVKLLDCQPEVGLVYTWIAAINHKGVPTGRIFASRAEGQVWEQLTAFNFIGCCSVAMVRRSCFETVGIFDASLHNAYEDWDMWLRIAAVYPFALIPEPLVYNRKYPGSSSTQWKRMALNFPTVIEKALKSAPSSLSYTKLRWLKQRSYGHANMCLAWKVVQSCEKDFQTALGFWKKALTWYPPIVFFRSYITLSIILGLVGCCGVEQYEKIADSINSIRRRVPRFM